MKIENVTQPNYAGFWIRVVAMLIDGVVWAVVGMVFATIMFALAPGLMVNMQNEEPRTVNVGNLISLILTVSFYAWFNSSKWMGTPGKIAVGIAVTDENGGRISFMRGVGRYFATIISGMLFCIGYIMVAFHPKKRALHDLMCNTYVVYRNR